jgi:hypothetical protein
LAVEVEWEVVGGVLVVAVVAGAETTEAVSMGLTKTSFTLSLGMLTPLLDLLVVAVAAAAVAAMGAPGNPRWRWQCHVSNHPAAATPTE